MCQGDGSLDTGHGDVVANMRNGSIVNTYDYDAYGNGNVASVLSTRISGYVFGYDGNVGFAPSPALSGITSKITYNYHSYVEMGLLNN